MPSEQQEASPGIGIALPHFFVRLIQLGRLREPAQPIQVTYGGVSGCREAIRLVILHRAEARRNMQHVVAHIHPASRTGEEQVLKVCRLERLEGSRDLGVARTRTGRPWVVELIARP
jgi:hypothetical protein